MVVELAGIHSLVAEMGTGCFLEDTLLQRHCRTAGARMLEQLKMFAFDKYMIPDEIVLTLTCCCCG